MPAIKLHECRDEDCEERFLTPQARDGHMVVHNEGGHPMQRLRGDKQ